MQAQNAPVTTAATVPGAIPGEIIVPVTVTGFTNIGAVSLTLEYDYSVMHFLQGTPHTQLSSAAIGDTDPGNGKHRVVMGWYGLGTSLPDGSAILTLSFTYINGFTELMWFDDGSSCEYADDSGNVLNDVPAITYYINGYVCGFLGSPGPITGPTSLCQGERRINYSVQPVVNATSYNWFVPAGATIISGNHTNSILVDFSIDAISGNIGVQGVNICESGPLSELGITVNELPVADAGNDTIIPYGTSATLHGASGGTGSFSYHWSPEDLLMDPNVQDPQTINLTTTTVFTLLVTNLSGPCQSLDEVIVTIIGGPLTTNPVCIPGDICRGDTSQLFANTGSGSGNYAYTWTCTPPDSPSWTSDQANPMVTPDSSKTYHLSVFDGFTTVSGSTMLTVYQLSTASISGGDTLCGDGLTTNLTVDLTGSPPWSFYYSNGLTTWFVPEQYTTPCTIVASQPGVYTILSLYDEHCNGTTSGAAEVTVFPVPPTPVITQYGNSLISSAYYGNQWYQEGILIPGAINQVYQPAMNANYFDIVTLNGCASEPSNEIYFVMIGSYQPENSPFLIEPNPAMDFIVIRSKTAMPDIEKIQIFTIQGKEEETFHVDPLAGKSNMTLNIQHLQPGLYFLVISTKYEKFAYKLIVQ